MSVLKGNTVIDDSFIACLSRFNVQKVPGVQDMKDTLTEVARCEFLLKLQAMMAEFKRGMFDSNSELWSPTMLEELNTLFESSQVNPDKVSDLITVCPMDEALNQEQDRISLSVA